MRDYNRSSVLRILTDYEDGLKRAMKRNQLDQDQRDIIFSQATTKYHRDSEKYYELKRDQFFATFKKTHLSLINLNSYLVFLN